MITCDFFGSSFWMGFIIGGIIFVAIAEFIHFVVIAALGVRGLEKELKRKNDILERKEPKL